MGNRCYYSPQPGPPGETGAGGICPDCEEHEISSYFCSQECYSHNLVRFPAPAVVRGELMIFRMYIATNSIVAEASTAKQTLWTYLDRLRISSCFLRFQDFRSNCGVDLVHYVQDIRVVYRGKIMYNHDQSAGYNLCLIRMSHDPRDHTQSYGHWRCVNRYTAKGFLRK